MAGADRGVAATGLDHPADLSGSGYRESVCRQLLRGAPIRPAPGRRPGAALPAHGVRPRAGSPGGLRTGRMGDRGGPAAAPPVSGSAHHSRKGYSEADWRQTSESFIRCLENAFRHFGGVPVSVAIDNLKAGVITSCAAMRSPRSKSRTRRPLRR